MNTLRPWATPLTIATTLVTVITGVLLFFHISPGVTRLSHEWIGMAMVAAVAFHLALNWRAFTTYFKRPVGIVLISAGVVATALTFALSPADPQGSGGMSAVMGAMEAADMTALAGLAKTDVGTVLQRLEAAGIQASADQTLARVSGGSRGQNMQTLRVILGN